jgi:hypothetical protein
MASSADGGRGVAARRLRGLALGVGLLVALGAGTAIAQDRVEGNRYSNPRYGIEIEKPPPWHFITASAVMDAARRAAGMAPLSSSTDPVKAAGFAVIVSKTPVLGREVAPQVITMVHELPSAPTDVIATCERLRSGMNDPEPVTPTQRIQVGGQPGARLDFKGIVDGAIVRATALCTFRGRRAYVVAAQALASEFDGEVLMFESILQSFRLR